jgi:hypothetical protein
MNPGESNRDVLPVNRLQAGKPKRNDVQNCFIAFPYVAHG